MTRGATGAEQRGAIVAGMSNSPHTLVCFAVRQEAAYFKRLTRKRADVEVLLTGMGKHNAARALRQALAESRPARVITAGFAGGLVPDLSFGAIVFCATSGTELEPRLSDAGARRARFHCAERIISRPEEKELLRRSSGAEAVEMESGAIHEVCAEFHLPVATVRVILDTAEEDLALDFNLLMNPNYEIDGRKLALTLLKSPGKIAALLRLQAKSNAAARRLGQVLAEVLA